MPDISPTTPHVALRGISVRFGSVLALDDVSLILEPGSRHAVVGENGAGKSTLMKVLFGLLRPTAGTLALDDEPVEFRSPKDALARGIGMVQQHFDLIAPFTVTENIVLGCEGTRAGVLDRQGDESAIRELAERTGFAIDPAARIETLSVASQQRVEILKALYRQARVLILDEPTAVLAPQEASDLWAATRRLTDDGVTVVFIAHKLDEVLRNADSVTVLRRGKHILTTPTNRTSATVLAQAMIGAVETVKASSSTISRRLPAEISRRDDLQHQSTAALEISGLSVRDDRRAIVLQDVNLTLGAGEILGIAGVDGNGQRELIEAMVGLRPIATGQIRANGQNLQANGIRQGIAYIPEDRQRDAVIQPMRCSENIILGRQREGEFATRSNLSGLIRVGAIRNALNNAASTWDVRGAEADPSVRALSGGNQQKLVLARELGRPDVRLVVASQPTRGLDFSATRFVHDALRRAAEEFGAGVVVQSLDLAELLTLCDRIAVLRAGRVVDILPRAVASESTIGALMTGASH